MLQLHLSDQQFYCLQICVLYWTGTNLKFNYKITTGCLSVTTNRYCVLGLAAGDISEGVFWALVRYISRHPPSMLSVAWYHAPGYPVSYFDNKFHD